AAEHGLDGWRLRRRLALQPRLHARDGHRDPERLAPECEVHAGPRVWPASSRCGPRRPELGPQPAELVEGWERVRREGEGPGEEVPRERCEVRDAGKCESGGAEGVSAEGRR